MIKTLKESKEILSQLVECASQGEEVIITVRGKPKARLCPIPQPSSTKKTQWGNGFREARVTYSTGANDSSKEILDQQREDCTLL